MAGFVYEKGWVGGFSAAANPFFFSEKTDSAAFCGKRRFRQEAS
jgi:hypothetical protein